MISIRHLSKTFTNPDGGTISPLKDVNCDIEKGEVISIIGPSGTGKSTLLRAKSSWTARMSRQDSIRLTSSA